MAFGDTSGRFVDNVFGNLVDDVLIDNELRQISCFILLSIKQRAHIGVCKSAL